MTPAAPLLIPRLPQGISRSWLVPGSKSVTNRALILAALAEGSSTIDNVLASDDTQRMREGLVALGIGVRDGGPGQLIVDGGRKRLRAPAGPLFVGNSGTTVRFLTALATLVPGSTTLVGDEHMAKRPIADLVEGLRQLGVRIECANGCPPLTIHGGRLPGGAVTMRGDRSSQYFSAILLVAGLAGGDVTVNVEGELVSRPYVDMTRRMVADFGGAIEPASSGFIARARTSYQARRYVVEPDASSASYPFALAAAGGHRIDVPGLTGETLQGDYGFIEVLERMGARVERTARSTAISAGGQLSGIDVDMHHISDTVMTLAAIAPLCSTPVTIRNIANIRIKETDRLAATVSELTRIGVRVESGDDWMRIHPGAVRPAAIECYHDHRMAMSFAVLGVIVGGISITDPGCTAKTYPGFWDDIAACYPAKPW